MLKKKIQEVYEFKDNKDDKRKIKSMHIIFGLGKKKKNL